MGLTVKHRPHHKVVAKNTTKNTKNQKVTKIKKKQTNIKKTSKNPLTNTFSPHANKQLSHCQPLKTQLLSVFYTNATSFNNDKRAELTGLCDTDYPPDLIMITETWFDSDAPVTLSNYSVHRFDRPSRGGGVAIYTRVGLETSEVEHHELVVKHSEQIWLKVTVGNENVLVGCIYRPGSCSEEANIENLSSIKFAKKLVDQKRFDCLITAGDFNFPEICWNEFGPTLTPRTGPGAKFFELVNVDF